jgi:hypothetical protein
MKQWDVDDVSNDNVSQWKNSERSSKAKSGGSE